MHLIRFKPKDFKLIIVDEAHHATSSTYRRIFEYFDVENPESGTCLWGCSATFRRHDGTALGLVFDDIAYDLGLAHMLEHGWLCPVKAVRINTKLDLSAVRVLKEDYDPKQLSAIVDTPERNALIVAQYQRFLQNERHSVLVFCLDIAHVTNLQAAFEVAGIKASSITSTTHPRQRAAALESFKARETPVLLNCAVLTEGTDIPNVDAIILARPTQSATLFTQMVGRGLRLFDDKENCLVVDLVGMFESHTLLGKGSTLEGGIEVEEEEDLEDGMTLMRLLHSFSDLACRRRGGRG